jgi:raffinose/stachyose/melibiose transport system permease protein
MESGQLLSEPSVDTKPLPLSASARWHSFARRNKLNSGLLFLVPALSVYLLFVAWPVVSIFQYGFYDWNGISRDRTFVGLQNYVDLLTKDRAFRLSIRNNLLWAVITVSVSLVLGFLFAYLLNQPLRLRNAYRAALFLPTTASLVVIGLTWKFIYRPDIGLLDQTLRGLGLNSLVRVWLSDAQVTLYATIVVAIWQSLGVWVVVYLAALQAIPQDLYDCAAIDGATGFRQMIHIAIPLTMSTTRALMILGFIGAVNQFGLVYLLSQGGPYHASEVIAYQIYDQAFKTNHTGYASALSVVLLLISAIITIVQLLFSHGRIELSG